jgi:hypothetical protein
MLRDDCDYCGGPANAWNGDAAWCSACDGKHRFDTWEPNLEIYMRPTPLQQFAATLLLIPLRLVLRFIPVRQLIEGRRFAIWVASNEMFYSYREAGMM